MEFIQMKLKPNEKSSWITYPDNYKFFSLHIYLSPDKKLIERKTDDLFEFLSRIGGFIEILLLMTRWLISPFALLRMNALLINRLFHLAHGTRKTARSI
jgi:hypothetical protein